VPIGRQFQCPDGIEDGNLHFGPRQKNDPAAATLNFKLNNLVPFTMEESYYRTRVVGGPNGKLEPPMFLGSYPNSWHDFRSEIGPTFTF